MHAVTLGFTCQYSLTYLTLTFDIVILGSLSKQCELVLIGLPVGSIVTFETCHNGEAVPSTYVTVLNVARAVGWLGVALRVVTRREENVGSVDLLGFFREVKHDRPSVTVLAQPLASCCR